jgi:hypothetical protein
MTEPVYVSTDGDAGPYIMVPVVQLERVTTVLDSSHVAYWVDEEAISLDGKPEVAVINLRQGSNPAAIQTILDNIP